VTTPVEEAAYDRFAAAYRDWWAPVIAPSALRLLDRLEGGLPREQPATVVDIGTGTGTLARAALARWPWVRAIGVDPARRMLEIAEASAREAGLHDRLTVRVGDAASLPLPAGSVDAAMSSFVLQLLPNRIAALREAYRVLRPGGLVACLIWRANEGPFEPEAVFDDALDELRLDVPDPPAGRGRPWTSPPSAAAELRRAGFRSVRAREEWLEHPFTPSTYVDMLEHWIEDEAFDTLDRPMRRRLREAVLRRLERLPPDALVWRRPLVSVIGRRPSATS